MILIRVGFLEFLLLVHVISAAVLFRRFFPRESPWLGFIVPIVVLVSVLNFIEHYIALPNLGWLLPFTLGGLIWNLVMPGYSWAGLKFPSILFALSFTFLLILKCSSPDIPNYTEGAVDLTRVLNYCMGEKVPPTDCWMPPYDYGGYYTFQHYGASVLKRLFSTDTGTALNLSFALLLALLCQMGAGAAYAISGKKWIASSIVLVLLSGSSGSAPILMLLGHPDFPLSTAINTAWNDPNRNPLSWICMHDQFHPDLTLVAPTYSLYCSEFHANLGATCLTMAAVLASLEIYRPGRSNWPWICLLVFPMVTLITSAWYFVISFILCAAGLGIACLAGRRPENLKMVALGGTLGLLFVWPAFYSLSATPLTTSFLWTPWQERTPLWIFAIQWWPIFVPWIFTCFVWHKLNWMCRWLHASIALLFIGMEIVSLSDRELTVQKMWGDLYGVGLITLLPFIFMQRRWLYRGLSAFLMITFLYCLTVWVKTIYYDCANKAEFGHLQGDAGIKVDPQRKRLIQVLSSMHGATILPGRSYWAYNLAPLIVTLSENRCFVAYTFQEEEAGHGDEILYRSKLNNDFYNGVMTSPLPFLHSNHISAVMIWPEDLISDATLQQIQAEIGSEYYYVNCKMGGVNNAGVFLHQAIQFASPTSTTPPSPLDLAAPPPAQ